ncbi:hypothetical protein Cgig2_031116 [Carnegiea gigantea]|uniref:Uncharacterized protein n=1 Tax=Carnegiea gigantea TaxID=171969 RepID=A0A9Q1Q779_9CARY|nr:hypothetical protein Cgig2_031116 [Carnegiea gigantea]
MVKGDVEGVEAIDLNSGGEARNMPQLWMCAAGLVRCCGVRLSWCSDLKVSSGKRRQPIMEGRRWRLKTAGDGFVLDKDGRGLPVTRRIVELGKDDLLMAELARMVMRKLLDANKEPDKLGLWLSLYDMDANEWGDVSENPKYIEDVRGMGEYAWDEALWRILMEAVEEM